MLLVCNSVSYDFGHERRYIEAWVFFIFLEVLYGVNVVGHEHMHFGAWVFSSSDILV